MIQDVGFCEGGIFQYLIRIQLIYKAVVYSVNHIFSILVYYVNYDFMKMW